MNFANDSIKFDVYVDAKGLKCPLPILRAKKALSQMQSGQILRIITTDINASNDFRIFSKQTDNVIISQNQYIIDNLEVVEHLIKKR
ncbi:putative redox protein, regulator of disulfide bond formation [Candidatus Kinetoplastibacterium desouzaii TCC079E]|uniref:Putative redox protein, regulator of disulfide bond formation n=1 Tax=Candidatus Kinetoplastidibacterium desouzai TCC079E TaxID=1208919 RepID=M1LS29_9PROT|nr:sulfurtransferase TusA family protein [Candidatus Kinetoplastibacterium desouzaii]AGF46951.1 putative redox protein, regulator of disulfide bond formation [Candidatus Kinetoplastibacterium desouzaii TCC079E]